MVEDSAFIKNTMLQFKGDSTSLRAPKSQYWFKSYDNFAEWVDIPIGRASAVEGLLSMGPSPSSIKRT